MILGLCVTLIRGHHWGGLPASLGYGAFVGGVTILAALVGVAAVWLEFLDGIVGLAVDGLAAILNIAGGVVSADVALTPETPANDSAVPGHQAQRHGLQGL